jgi:hypothetical protein
MHIAGAPLIQYGTLSVRNNWSSLTSTYDNQDNQVHPERRFPAFIGGVRDQGAA